MTFPKLCFCLIFFHFYVVEFTHLLRHLEFELCLSTVLFITLLLIRFHLFLFLILGVLEEWGPEDSHLRSGLMSLVVWHFPYHLVLLHIARPEKSLLWILIGIQLNYFDKDPYLSRFPFKQDSVGCSSGREKDNKIAFII